MRSLKFSKKIALFLLTIGAFALHFNVWAAEEPTVIPAPALEQSKAASGLQTAVLAGGCFWGVQGVFQRVRGVKKVWSGYAGGDKNTAKYELVGSGKTGHAEAVEITFNPAEISYGELLHIFFSVAHDPTQLNRQGPDTGTQYRSAIFYTDDAQKSVAEAYIDQLNSAKAFPKPIVTKLDPLKGFYKAEDYHQDFLINNPRYPYIVHNDLPKIENLKRIFPAVYKGVPVKVTDKVIVQ
ncbi:MAG: peptide-methionine (S)-S-oxide reductase [Gammaproteobacteria bacterium]|nr:MAG: peptide-methionine (S)-S-oxide reductase [Gammaproteobacteria bacterium]